MVVEPITCIKPTGPMISTRQSGGIACDIACDAMRCAVQTNAASPPLHTDGGTYGRPVEWDSALDVLLQKLASSRLSNYWERYWQT